MFRFLLTRSGRPVRRLFLILLAPLCFAQTGIPVPEFSALDAIMERALSRYSVKGGSLAVVMNGHLVFARGYGLADVESGRSVQPDSLFRWCSMSKALTGVALLRLVEQNRLDLDTPIFDVLDQFAPYHGVWSDSRIRAITVRQVLHHTAGWDHLASPFRDPVIGAGTVRVSQITGTAFPPSLDSVIRYMLAQPLDFAPGSRFVYSNFGYELLGRVVEKVSGQPYARFVRETILEPLGLSSVQQASAHLAGRLPGEVTYYDYPGAPLVNSFVSASREKVPAPYGLLSPELLDSAGAWAGSAIDVAKLTSCFDGMRPPGILTADSFRDMLAQSQPPTWVRDGTWYGFGLLVKQSGTGLTWHHSGAVPGSRGMFRRFPNGSGFAFLFNGDTADATSLSDYVTQAIADVLGSVRTWPQTDLFPRYYPPRISRGGVVDASTFQSSPLVPGCAIAIFGADLGGRDSGVVVRLRDAAGSEHTIELLHSDPYQINARLPASAALGAATLAVSREAWPEAIAEIYLESGSHQESATAGPALPN